MNKQGHTLSDVMPPPLPATLYHVAINGKAAGPFDHAALSQMAVNGQLTVDSLVWKSGMAQWNCAGAVEDQKDLLIQCLRYRKNRGECRND